MKKVLLVTYSKDNDCIRMVSEAIKKRGGQPVRFDTDFYPGEVGLSLHDNNGNWENTVHTPEGSFNISEFESIWYRRIRIGQNLHNVLEEKFLQPSINESRLSFFGMLASCNVFQLDPFLKVRNSEIKQLQLQVAHSLGLKVPKTLISNNSDAVKKFFHACKNGMISKMMASFAIYEDGKENVVFTNLMNEKDLAEMDGLKYCPMTFQEIIPKKLELRITVVGEQVFTASIDSQKQEAAKSDWRKKGIEFMNDWKKFDLPKDIEKKLLALMDYFGLNYGAIDMILTPNDELYFLEVNPVGEFFWLELKPGFPVSSALADVLMGNIKRRYAQRELGFAFTEGLSSQRDDLKGLLQQFFPSENDDARVFPSGSSLGVG